MPLFQFTDSKFIQLFSLTNLCGMTTIAMGAGMLPIALGMLGRY